MRSKRALLNIISSLLFQLVSVICGFIIPRLIIRAYGSNVNGLTASITQFLAYISLIESGFGGVVMSMLYKPIANNEKSTIEEILKSSDRFFKTVSYIFIIYIIFLCIALPQILLKEFDISFTVSLIIIISISTFSEYYFGMTYRLYICSTQRMYVISFIKIITLILNTIMTIILVHVGASIQIVKIVSALIFILRPVLQNIYVKKKFNINIRNAKPGYKITQKWDGFAQHIATVVHNNADVVILTLLANTIEVSVYSVYLLVLSGIRNIVSALIDGIGATFGDMIAKNEKELLNKNFKTCEDFYFTISTIICISTMLLILPFVGVYTKGITDANYIRPLFSYLIVIAEFMYIIRMPYSTLTKAAGHYKETRKGAWIEAITNICLSLILVWKFGMVGVAIGTLVAMFIRTIEFMYHSSKHILNRSLLYTLKRIIIIGLEAILVAIIVYIIPDINVTSYSTWMIEAIIVTSITIVIVILINYFIYKENIKNVISVVKNIFSKNGYKLT